MGRLYRSLRSAAVTSALAVLAFPVLSYSSSAQAACVAPVGPAIDTGFAPEGSAERLVLKAICTARHSVHLSAYSFTSPAIVQALIEAHRRGVDVAVVADRKSNLVEDRSGKGRIALDLLSGSGVGVRTIDVYPIHHDKFMVIDGESVETGSFNYTTSAARYNSENAVVMWHVPVVAQAYQQHWQSRFNQGRPWSGQASN
ncbi:phosphatidylserine/phosphatidylglycerophosphate/cardiolipin synthase-like enzyme [Paraburkholderia terricola]|uniref:phospholipase D family nuclease n=1 Tax=Paraburkholderia terricola TaxID=169427 RepID=UPI00285DEA44|nr:phospholipase D family protein [Paraburkholderia terricola]MDR6495998.1 phosphatidylserine/phosphatidylglycerophosphate/cardiolipin synthase-like enzyme [Paraburkholderia terricola]